MKQRSFLLLQIALILAVLFCCGTTMPVFCADAQQDDGGEDGGAISDDGRLDKTMQEVDVNKTANTTSSYVAPKADDLKSGAANSCSAGTAAVSLSSLGTAAVSLNSSGTTPVSVNSSSTATPSTDNANTATSQSGSGNASSGASNVTNPFGNMAGKQPDAVNRSTAGQAADNIAIPVSRPANTGNADGGTTNATSLATDRQAAFDLFKQAVRDQDKATFEKAIDMFQKLVFATDGKDGKQLYFLGRCQEEISKLTGDSSVMNKANANFKKAAEVLTKTPDPTQAVSATDATDKAETTTSAANSAGFSSWPIASPVVNSKFGMRNGKPHRGIDLRARSPLPLKAIADGKVVQVTTQSGYGKVLAIEHNINGKKYYSFYAHLSNNSIAVGTAVKAGQDIPTVRTGNTGVGTGPHLHFEIRVGENNKLKAQDPLKFLGTFDYKKK
ncbi:MAG TPA: peptidoglycan DD-metalloendopeptidase family protein [Candidatus Wallbacteria bacterium]|nr:peptidoglycan DD-metalloendopeptidase family protein [Candidatus Wallbacteria bacterium]